MPFGKKVFKLSKKKFSSTVVLSERDLEVCDQRDSVTTSTKMSGHRRHLSKSTSELSSPRDDFDEPYGIDRAENRPQSAAPPGTTHMSVVQKAHSFLSQLKVSEYFFDNVRLLIVNVFFWFALLSSL